jgi:hypothetical protein
VASAGVFGFYPWINSVNTYYGIIAREAAPCSGDASAVYGRNTGKGL